MGVGEMLLGWLHSALVSYRRVRVTVHRACFTHSGVWAYFINITNLSRDRDIEITHVWLASQPEVFPIIHDRRLPKRLKPDEVWETWIEERRVPLPWRGQ